MDEAEVFYHGTGQLLNAESSHRAGLKVQFRLDVEDDYKIFKQLTKRNKSRAGQVMQLFWRTGEADMHRVEVCFQGWSVSNTQGAIVAFQLNDEGDWRAFRQSPAIAAGGEHGLSVEMTIFELDGEGRAINQAQRLKVEHGMDLKGGPKAKFAARRCKEEGFRQWVAGGTGPPVTEAEAKAIVLAQCNISSRKEFDSNDAAWAEFELVFNKPFIAWEAQRL